MAGRNRGPLSRRAVIAPDTLVELLPSQRLAHTVNQAVEVALAGDRKSALNDCYYQVVEAPDIGQGPEAKRSGSSHAAR